MREETGNRQCCTCRYWKMDSPGYMHHDCLENDIKTPYDEVCCAWKPKEKETRK